MSATNYKIGEGPKTLKPPSLRSVFNENPEQGRVIAATVIGTSLEWYDFFVYASAAGLVFGKLFFEPAGPSAAMLLSFATVGVSFLFRPFGAVIAGHLGDKYGRRFVLVMTLWLMGAATALIGLLPTYEAIGIAAPIILVLLRVVQGISAGGEWGGAVLMAVEHAAPGRRGLLGAPPQIGVPLGLLLASAVMAITAWIAPGDAFLSWGWRIPFLISILLVFVGYWVRKSVEESPVFKEISERKEETKTPLKELLKNFLPLVIVAALVFAGNNAVGYMTTGGFIQAYAANPEGPLGLPRAEILWAVAGGAVVWLVSTLIAGWVSDFIGRKNTYFIGWGLQLLGVLALFPIINLGSAWWLLLGLAFLSIGLGFTYGPQAAFYAELYPASVRFSGVSISYALGAVLGGAFSPLIAQALMQQTGTWTAIVIYLAGMTLIGFLATAALRDRSSIPLGPSHEAEQAQSPLIWHKG
ncbi:MFS transporter [Actinomyces minihominis]|uniref:MFS transporter n=1 Tax=Actinomyces minihominis TaxID=2002838 RepID=UPI000C076151|nr:MFS transporter [Actinomyces minihominis]